MLEVRELTKEFPSVVALDKVDLELVSGEVHGVIGENGAGKSTLMKVIAGIYQPTSGEMLLDGKVARFRSTREAIDSGIAMIHQELNLVDELSVAENIFLGREPHKGPLVNRSEMNDRAAAFLQQVAAPFRPDTPVGNLSIANKQLVEIAKALAYNARLIIMDEPTAVLSERETSALFSLIARLKQEGVTILYISHILKELLQVCDRITVMRDGRRITTLPAAEASPSILANLMVGRELEDFYPAKHPAPSGDPLLRVESLSVEGWAQDISFEIRPGEILGIAGLVGSGRTETAEAIVGVRPRSSGRIIMNGQEIKVRSPREAMKHGIAYVSEDRKAYGLVLSMSTVSNVTLANLKTYAHPIIRPNVERHITQGWIEKLNIRVPDPSAEVLYLSGGNQQKVSLAKWLDTGPKVLILDEPTRGVDVGAKREIYNLIQSLADAGLACLVISSEMQELIGLCHRIVVMREGRIMGELIDEQMTEQNIMMLAAAVQEPAA